MKHIRSATSALVLAVAGFAAPALQAQDNAVKTNIIYDALATVNVGYERVLREKWTLDLSANVNLWKMGERSRWKHVLFQPEVRYWLLECFNGHFIGPQISVGQYNIGHINLPWDFLGNDFSSLTEHRYEGWFAGVAFSYGYAWILNYHWNLEAEISFGWAYSRYDRYNCAGCGRRTQTNHPHNYVGPTKAAFSVVYLF